ncbi:MAG TPA: diguanylate cyclase [Burkholderiales bacterium]|nr:diguanylate cyclase [Burkholderiales bacterium]
MKVLIADDDDVVLTVLEGLLDHLGHEAVVAHDGTEAWELIQREDAPQLVILDWMMPGIDGVEICRRIRQDVKRPYQYLIMLTAKDEMEDLVEGMKSGADDYLRKPFDERELRARLHAGERILAMQDDLRARATFDELTGLLNRATILERLDRELKVSSRTGAPVSVVLADLDDFKRVNDTHGHPVGDEVLREASKRMAGRMRSYDDLGRYGGEEFLGVLPGCPPAGVLAVAERMRHSVGTLSITTVAGPIELTVSFGVATSDPARPLLASALVAAADEALYRAKRSGRNRVEAAPETAPPQ